MSRAEFKTQFRQAIDNDDKTAMYQLLSDLDQCWKRCGKTHWICRTCFASFHETSELQEHADVYTHPVSHDDIWPTGQFRPRRES